MNLNREIVTRTATILSLCCFLVIVTISATSRMNQHPGKSSPNQVDVDYRFQESGITLHEPVVVVFAVHNGLSQPITLTLGADSRQFFHFSLTTPDGQVLQGSGTPELEHSVSYLVFDGEAVVAPGADYQLPLLINRTFPFTTSGAYLLTSQLTTKIAVPEDGGLPPQSKTIRLAIHPRDPARLDKVCAELSGQVENASTIAAVRLPMLELSFVDDPIAVPYLARVLSNHALSSELAIPGLERIGNDEAIEVLLTALNSKYADIADLATRTLARMEDRITNGPLKETVKKAVEHSSERARNEFIKTQIAYLDYRSPILQQTAIQNLIRVEDGLQQAEPVLQRLANDPNQPTDVRAAAMDALQKLHPPGR